MKKKGINTQNPPLVHYAAVFYYPLCSRGFLCLLYLYRRDAVCISYPQHMELETTHIYSLTVSVGWEPFAA